MYKTRWSLFQVLHEIDKGIGETVQAPP